jgi:Mrp family chromosome partitioning ATPase
MVDLTREMGSLLAALGPGPEGRGRVLQFASAVTGEGVSTVARAFARVAAVRARRPVWLVDADLDAQSQMAAIAGEPELFGGLGRVAGASPDGSAFFAVSPPNRDASGRPVPDAAMFVARPAMGSRLWVTRLRLDAMNFDQRAQVRGSGEYWKALARHAETVVIDSPAADRSDTALRLARFVDATVIVLAAEETDAASAAGLRDALEAAGGRVAGLVFNRMRLGAKPQKRAS